MTVAGSDVERYEHQKAMENALYAAEFEGLIQPGAISRPVVGKRLVELLEVAGYVLVRRVEDEFLPDSL